MAIRAVVTRGFGNGTFDGSIAGVVRRGYIAGVVVVPNYGKAQFVIRSRDTKFVAKHRENRFKL